MEIQEPRKAKAIFKKKYKREGFTLPDIKIYYKTIVVKPRGIMGKRVEQTLPKEDKWPINIQKGCTRHWSSGRCKKPQRDTTTDVSGCLNFNRHTECWEDVEPLEPSYTAERNVNR